MALLLILSILCSIHAINALDLPTSNVPIPPNIPNVPIPPDQGVPDVADIADVAVPSAVTQALDSLSQNTLMKSKATKVEESINAMYCEDVEFLAQCTSKQCEMMPKKSNGKQAAIQQMKAYENMYDAATFDFSNDMVTVKYRKGDCQGVISHPLKIYYDAAKKCISKTVSNYDALQITEFDTGNHISSDNSLKKFMSKIKSNCAFDKPKRSDTAAGVSYGNDYERDMDTYDMDYNAEYFVNLLIYLLILLLIFNIIYLTYTNCYKSAKRGRVKFDLVSTVSTSDEEAQHLNK